MTDEAEMIRAELYLQSAEAGFKRGHKNMLIDAMALCVDMNIAWPKWVKAGFLNAYKSVPDSWDAVFDRPLPKGKSAQTKRKWTKLQPLIYRRVEQLRAERKPTGDSRSEDSVFVKVGKELGVSGGRAKTMYYDFIQRREAYQRSMAVLAGMTPGAKIHSKKLAKD